MSVVELGFGLVRGFLAGECIVYRLLSVAERNRKVPLKLK